MTDRHLLLAPKSAPRATCQECRRHGAWDAADWGGSGENCGNDFHNNQMPVARNYPWRNSRREGGEYA